MTLWRVGFSQRVGNELFSLQQFLLGSIFLKCPMYLPTLLIRFCRKDFNLLCCRAVLNSCKPQYSIDRHAAMDAAGSKWLLFEHFISCKRTDQASRAGTLGDSSSGEMSKPHCPIHFPGVSLRSGGCPHKAGVWGCRPTLPSQWSGHLIIPSWFC